MPMEKKAWFQEVSLAKVFETMVDLEGARAALRFLSGKGAGPLSPDAPPPPEVEAELQAFAEALTPERLSGAIRLAPEGVHLFGGAFFLPYGDGWAYGEGLQRAHTWAAWMWSLGHYEETWEVLERLLPGKKKGTPQLPRRRHPAYRLLLSYGDYLALTHTPRDPVAWAWLLDLDPSRVREVVDRALAQWLRDEEASRDFREAFQPWEVLRHLGNPAAYLHARRLLALDGERFFREWRRHPEALLSFLSLGHVSLDWEAYRGLLRRGYALLRAQGWGEGEARWLLAYPSLTRGVRKEPPFAEGRVPRELLSRLLSLLLRAGILQEPGRGLPWLRELDHEDWGLLLGLLAEDPDPSPAQEEAMVAVLRAWGRGPGEEDALLALPLLKRALEEPWRFAALRDKNLGLRALAERALGRPEPLFPEPFARGGLVAVELLSPEALEEEGKAMGHCLGREAWTWVFLGEKRFFGLRDGEGRPVATLALWRAPEGWRAAEVRGPGNAEVSPEVRAFAQELAEAAQAPQSLAL